MDFMLIVFLVIASAVFGLALGSSRFGPGFAFGLIINGFILYFIMPALTIVAGLFLVALEAAAGGVLGILATDSGFGFSPAFRHHQTSRFGPALFLFVGAAIIVLLILGAILAPLLCASQFYALPQVTTGISNNNSLVSSGHIREVSEETARWRADKAVGNIGYKVGVGQMNIQSKDGKLVWLAPLDYTGTWKAWSYGQEGTGGYVLVSAEDSKDQVKLVETTIRHTPHGLFGYNLERTLYFDYPTYLKGETTFQLDDKGEPVWVTMLSNPAVLGMYGHVPVGIAVTNPSSGGNTFYYMNEVPTWVERVMDEEVNEEYLTYWGKYKYGFWNTIFDQKDYLKPTGGLEITDEGGNVQVGQGENPDVYLVQGTDGKLYWFGSFTTVGKDTSMVGYTLTDLRTGKIVFYPTPSVYNDIGAAKNVQQHPEVAKVMGARVTQPIMYLVDGQEVWIMPVITPSGENVMMGAVVAKTGETYVSPTLDGTLRQLHGQTIQADTVSPGSSTTLASLVAELDSDLARLKEYIKNHPEE